MNLTLWFEQINISVININIILILKKILTVEDAKFFFGVCELANVFYLFLSEQFLRYVKTYIRKIAERRSRKKQSMEESVVLNTKDKEGTSESENSEELVDIDNLDNGKLNSGFKKSKQIKTKKGAKNRRKTSAKIKRKNNKKIEADRNSKKASENSRSSNVSSKYLKNRGFSVKISGRRSLIKNMRNSKSSLKQTRKSDSGNWNVSQSFKEPQNLVQVGLKDKNKSLNSQNMGQGSWISKNTLAVTMLSNSEQNSGKYRLTKTMTSNLEKFSSPEASEIFEKPAKNESRKKQKSEIFTEIEYYRNFCHMWFR